MNRFLFAGNQLDVSRLQAELSIGTVTHAEAIEVLNALVGPVRAEHAGNVSVLQRHVVARIDPDTGRLGFGSGMVAL